MSWLGSWGRVIEKIDTLLKIRAKSSNGRQAPPHDPVGRQAKEILEKLRWGTYIFSEVELAELLRTYKWLGDWQKRFLKLQIGSGNRIGFVFRLPRNGRVQLRLSVLDLWHDRRISSMDFRIDSTELPDMPVAWLQKPSAWILRHLFYLILRWKNPWQQDRMSFILKEDGIVRLYFGLQENSTLMRNLTVIGVQTEPGTVTFFTYRGSERGAVDNIDQAGSLPSGHWGFQRIWVFFTWLLLGAYVFVLIHVTFPVLSGAFQMMPQTGGVWDRFILTQLYNFCVILLSYFFFRITMFPLFLKWGKAKQEFETLGALERRDHQYLRPLTNLVRQMQSSMHQEGVGHSSEARELNDAVKQSIAQMVGLMGSLRAESEHRLRRINLMRQSWLKDIAIGYVMVFFLEWLYWQGLLTPLSASIRWMNHLMDNLLR